MSRLYSAGALLVEAIVFKNSVIEKNEKVTLGETCDQLEVTFPDVVEEKLVSAVKSLHPDNYESLHDEGVDDPYESLRRCGGALVRLWWD